MPVLKILEMSATSVYMVKSAHLNKNDLLKRSEQAYVHDATTNVRKYDIFSNFQKAPKHFKKTHGTSPNVCDDNEQDKGRL